MESMDQETEPLQAPPPPPFAELIASLEQATEMAKQLNSPLDQTHLFQIYSSLNQAHMRLSSFLSSVPPRVSGNCLPSATGLAGEPMQVGDDEDGENDRNSGVEKVEERLRECFIKNKRQKRPLPPAAAVEEEERKVCEDGVKGFDPHWRKLRALDLIYQFHG